MYIFTFCHCHTEFFLGGGVVLWNITLNVCSMNQFSVSTCDIEPRPSTLMVFLMIQWTSLPSLVMEIFNLHYDHFFRGQ